jgi:hypothetical protein
MGTIVAQKSNTIYVPIYDAPYTLPRAVSQPFWGSDTAAVLQDNFSGSYGVFGSYGFTETSPSGGAYTAIPPIITNVGATGFLFELLAMQGIFRLPNITLNGYEYNPFGIFRFPADTGASRILPGPIPVDVVQGFTDQNTQQYYPGTFPLSSPMKMLLNGKTYIGAMNATAYSNAIIAYGYNIGKYLDICRVQIVPYVHTFSDSMLAHYPSMDANVCLFNTTLGTSYIRLIKYGFNRTVGGYVTYSDNIVSFDDPNYGGQGEGISNVPTGFLFNPTLATQNKLCILDPSGLFYHPIVLVPQTANALNALANQAMATYAPSPGISIDASGIVYIVGNPQSTTQSQRYVGISNPVLLGLPSNLSASNLSPIPLPCFSPCATIGNLPIQ